MNRTSDLTVTIIVPVLNEESTLIEVSRRLNSVLSVVAGHYLFEILFVDNGSTDKSPQILRNLIDEGFPNTYSTRLLLQPKKGKGNAVRAAIKESTGVIVVIIDADLEYDLNELPQILGYHIGANAGMTLGSRHIGHFSSREFLNSKILSVYFNLGHWFFTLMFNLLFQTRLTDPATMWKVMNGKMLRSFELVGEGFELDWELVAHFIRMKSDVIEVPVSYKSRTIKDGKKISPIRDPLKWCIFIPYLRFRKIHQ